MQFHKLPAHEWGKALGLGIANGVALSVIMVVMMQIGVSPLPAPLGLAFAETLVGRTLPLPVGLARGAGCYGPPVLARSPPVRWFLSLAPSRIDRCHRCPRTP